MKNIKNIGTIIGAVLLIGSIGFIIFQNNQRGKTIQMLLKNQENANRERLELKEDLIQYTFDSNKQLEEFLELQEKSNGALSGLKQKLESQDLKLNRIDRIVTTQISAVDNTNNQIVLDSLGKIFDWIKAYKEGDSLSIPFEDKSTCFEFKARLLFKDGQTSVEVLERKYQDTIYHVSTWERNKWNFLGLWNWRFMGRKISTVEIFNECGFSKTFVIDNTKATRKRKKR